MNIEDIKLLYAYNTWANKLILSHAAKLTAEQLHQPTSFSWENLHKTLVHTLDAEYGWRMLCQHGSITFDMDPQNFPDIAAIQARWDEEEQAMLEYLDSIDDLDAIISYEVAEGIRNRVLWHCLIHVVNHGTQHRSECAAMLTDFGHSPGGIDLTLFLNQ